MGAMSAPRPRSALKACRWSPQTGRPVAAGAVDGEPPGVEAEAGRAHWPCYTPGLVQSRSEAAAGPGGNGAARLLAGACRPISPKTAGSTPRRDPDEPTQWHVPSGPGCGTPGPWQDF